MLFLCLTRWDLLYDLCILRTQVKDATVAQLKECNRIIWVATKYTERGLVFEALSGRRGQPWADSRRRLAAVADSSHASSKSSYAFEGNLVFLQAECGAKEQSTKDYEQVLRAANISGLSGRVHPLHVRSQKMKRLSQSTSHAETLSQLSCTVVAECVAMRYTEMHLAWQGGVGTDIRRYSLHHGTPTLQTLWRQISMGCMSCPWMPGQIV